MQIHVMYWKKNKSPFAVFRNYMLRTTTVARTRISEIQEEILEKSTFGNNWTQKL